MDAAEDPNKLPSLEVSWRSEGSFEQVAKGLQLTNFDRRPLRALPPALRSLPGSTKHSKGSRPDSSSSSQRSTRAPATPGSAMGRSASTPSVSGTMHRWQWHIQGSVPQWEKHRQQVSLSPQGLFARCPPPQYCAYGNELQDRWHRRSPGSTGWGSPSALKRKRIEAQLLGQDPPRQASLLSTLVTAEPTTATDRVSSWQDMKARKDLFDIREGMRLAFLNIAPSPLGTPKVWPPPKADRVPPTQEQTLKIWTSFCKFLHNDGFDGFDLVSEAPPDDPPPGPTDDPRVVWPAFFLEDLETSLKKKAAAAGRAGDENILGLPTAIRALNEKTEELLGPPQDKSGASVFTAASASMAASGPGRCRELPHINWGNFFNWVDQKYDICTNNHWKSVYEALLKALSTWRMEKATPCQRVLGVSFSMIIRWIWPLTTPAKMEGMLKSIGYWELEKVRRPEPPTSTYRERRAMYGVFEAMDWRGRGYCRPVDIAGGENQDFTQQSYNLIDEASANQILGEVNIHLPEFCELMCEDGFRGHKDSVHAINHGRPKGLTAEAEDQNFHMVEKHEHEILDWNGWVLRDVPYWEATIFKRVAALEAAVLHWRGEASNFQTP